MTFLLKLFVRDYENTGDPVVRRRYGTLSGVLGLICNALLFALKLTVGLLISSVAVISDAFNNLADMGSTLISLVGVRLSGRKPDRDHPFGHGRMEYLSALIVSFLILLVGFELLKSSVETILSPKAAEDINWLLIGLLALSLPVKLFMFAYNRFFGKKINSQPLLATGLDSRNDCIATSAVLLSAIFDGLHLLPFSVDGYVGALVSLLIMYAGFSVAKDTIALLLGKPPEAETVDALQTELMKTPGVLGSHDLIVHDYGPGRQFASVHAEISAHADIMEAHEAIDEAETRVFRETGIELSIHLDPILTDDPVLNRARETILASLKEQGLAWTIHDLRMTDGKENINLIFDIVVPFEVSAKDCSAALHTIRERLREDDPRLTAVIKVDRDYIAQA